MIEIYCPNCGDRNAQEFRYGGEYNPRPNDPTSQDDAGWAGYVYFKDNRAGEQQEWWLHQAGCGLWFLARRDTRTNRFIKTWRWSQEGRL